MKHNHRWLSKTCMISGAMMIAIAGASAQPTDSPGRSSEENAAMTVELPLLAGWYQGQLVHYVTTDISDQGMAKGAAINYVPRLKSALRAPTPGQPSAVDRVYKFANSDQGSVFPSAPQPTGYTSASTDYTPLWVVYMVTWLPGSKPRVLHSEEEVMAAEEGKLISIAPTNIVINCPILFVGRDSKTDGMVIHVQKP
jgi:hypothetical protein